LETCPVRPGQEDRSWNALRERLNPASIGASKWAWLYVPTWRGALVGLSAVCGLALIGNILVARYQPVSFASASSEAPGIFATSFYSSSAKAQVVWLNGLEPASDKPTYLDPTTVIPASGDPDSL
jgi:hypothetical protein